jgi:PEP-CTERM motif
MGRFFVCLASLTLLAGGLRQAKADSVLLLSTDVPAEDTAVMNLLTADGHTVTLGPVYSTNVPWGSLSGYSSVILLQNNTISGANILSANQTALVNYVNGGGGLLTSEWTVWGNAAAGNNTILAPVLPVIPSTDVSFRSPITYTQTTANSVLNSGLPSSFTFPAYNLGGTETYFQPKTGATVYYGSDFEISVGTPLGDGMIGWSYGSGQVLSLSTLAGQNELADPNYGTLFSNAVYFVSAVPEPSTLILLSIGALGLTLHHCWRRRKQAA